MALNGCVLVALLFFAYFQQMIEAKSMSIFDKKRASIEREDTGLILDRQQPGINNRREIDSSGSEDPFEGGEGAGGGRQPEFLPGGQISINVQMRPNTDSQGSAAPAEAELLLPPLIQVPHPSAAMIVGSGGAGANKPMDEYSEDPFEVEKAFSNWSPPSSPPLPAGNATGSQ